MCQACRTIWLLSLVWSVRSDAFCSAVKLTLSPAGDLLRAEQVREGSEYGTLIQTCIKEGTIVPMEVTIKLLENAMQAAMAGERPGQGWKEGRGRFLIDGFPRKMDQAVKFDETVCLSSVVLFFSTSEEIMEKRLLVRAKTSGREDDNLESIKKRFRTYENDTLPVIEYYASQGKVAKVEATGTIEEIYALGSQAAHDALAGKYPKVVA
ncbi:UMP-CMP kinase [Termitomyces sp. 'cryptogamus']|nr:UMP-CMP kinase [Termitomyces sp. 'cryptogamus']